MLKNDRHTFRITWSEQDNEHIGLDSPSSTWGGVDDSGKMPYHHTYIDTQLLKIAAVENRLIRRKDTRFQ